MTQFDALFAALQATGVRYVVVGGVAVNLHGYQRFTKDIDIVIELVPEQTLKAIEALTAIGYKPSLPVKAAEFADPAIRKGWIRDKGMTVFQLCSDRSRLSVNIFADYPLDFEQLWGQAVALRLASASPRIASINHLIEMKRKVGRLQDLLDIEKLEQIKHLLGSQEGSPPMNDKATPTEGSFEAAEVNQLRRALESSYAQRLQDLQEMLDFNAEAEARNPQLKAVAARLRR